MAGVSIVHRDLQQQTHDVFDVNFYGDTIEVIVTPAPTVVDSWIFGTLRAGGTETNPLIVGLDIEWRPNDRNHDNPVAILQLCAGGRCLIFQILHAPHIPQSLVLFLSNPNVSFVGVGIDEDAEKLLGDYNLRVRKTVDLRPLAAAGLGATALRKAGLKTLAMEVLGKEMSKPKRVTRSRWDVEWLSLDQILYACLDALLSFQIGRRLIA